jgi:toxin ParE1/3/4
VAQINWTEPALQDLYEIAEYIDFSNPDAAQRLILKIFSTVERLEQFPESGKEVLELEGFGYREVVVNPCRVFYKIDRDEVFVLHVMRQEQDLKRYLLSPKIFS